MLEDLRKGLKLEESTFLYIKKYQKHVYVIIRDPTCLNLLWPVPAILDKRHLTVDPRLFPPSSGSGIWMMSRPCLCATPEDGWTLDDCGRCFSFLPQCLQALQTDATPDKRGASSCQQASHQGPRQAVQYLELMHLNKITTVRLPQTHH